MPTEENVTGKRIVAALIDIAILAGIFLVFSVVAGDTETGTRDTANGTTSGIQFNLTGWPMALYLVVVAAYYIGSEAAVSATPGKLALGLRVASADGSTLSLGKVIVRNLLRIVDGLPFLYLVGIITIAASKRDQRVGDMAAGTIVVRAQEVRGQPEQTYSMMNDRPSPPDP